MKRYSIRNDIFRYLAVEPVFADEPATLVEEVESPQVQLEKSPIVQETIVPEPITPLGKFTN